jgi:hypothetical protein
VPTYTVELFPLTEVQLLHVEPLFIKNIMDVLLEYTKIDHYYLKETTQEVYLSSILEEHLKKQYVENKASILGEIVEMLLVIALKDHPEIMSKLEYMFDLEGKNYRVKEIT